MALKSGHKAVLVTGEEGERQKEFHGYKEGTVRLVPDGWFFTTYYTEYADRYYDFQFKPKDIVIMTYPKCGTTWTQEIIWTLLKNPNLDNPNTDLPMYIRSPFLEFDFITKPYPYERGYDYYDIFIKSYPNRDPDDAMFMQFVELSDEPRIIKTHLPFSLLSPKLIDTCKIIYVARDPKDVAVSYLHHSKLLTVHGYMGNNDQFVDHFVSDTLLFSPFWTHLKEGWEKRNHPNVHFCFYEDMKDEPKVEVIRIQKFLGIDHSEKQIENVIKYTSFSAMKEREETFNENSHVANRGGNKYINPKVMAKDGSFLRKGVTGDWKKKLTREQVEKIQEWTNKNIAAFGPDFKYRN